MNLLFTLTSYPPAVGGAQLHTHQIVKRLATELPVQVLTYWRTHRTDWLLGTTLRAPRESISYSIDGVPVQTLTLTRSERWRIMPYVLSYYALQRVAIERISAILQPKMLSYAKEIDLIHHARIGREGLSYASLAVARKLDVPFVFVPYHHPRWVGWRYKEYLALYRDADALIALTNAEKEKLIALGVKEERIFITGIGPVLADISKPAEERQHYGLTGQPVVLFLGQKYKYKGVASLLEASKEVWRQHPDTLFLFIGPRTRFSKRLFQEVNDARIVELGTVSLQQKSDLLAACTLLCVPSSQESFGGVYTEAWMMGKPVIGGDIPAIRDVISEGEDGFVVPQEAAIIAERIIYLLDHPTKAAQLGQNGKQKVLEHYTWEQLAAKTKSVYDAVL